MPTIRDTAIRMGEFAKACRKRSSSLNPTRRAVYKYFAEKAQRRSQRLHRMADSSDAYLRRNPYGVNRKRVGREYDSVKVVRTERGVMMRLKPGSWSDKRRLQRERRKKRRAVKRRRGW